MNIDDNSINNLQNFLKSEEFDTESVSMDVIQDNHGENGNISKIIKDKKSFAAISKFIASFFGMLYISFTFLQCIMDHFLFVVIHVLKF